MPPQATCEACSRPILSPGHGRRFCETCSPPTALRAQTCAHGEIGPCGECYGISILKRRCRKTGGRGVRITERDLTTERERVATERRLLNASDLTAEQKREVRAWLTADHRQSMADIRAELAA